MPQHGASGHPIWPKSEEIKDGPCAGSERSAGSGVLESVTKVSWQVISLFPDVETILFNTSLQ